MLQIHLGQFAFPKMVKPTYLLLLILSLLSWRCLSTLKKVLAHMSSGFNQSNIAELQDEFQAI